MREKLEFKNVNSPIIELCQLELRRESEKSSYVTVCPACNEGSLLMRRDHDTLKLSEFDRCLLCGQTVRYLDIEILRGREKNG